MKIRKKPNLKIIPGERAILEQEVVRLAWFGSNAELKAGIARLEHRGSLSLVEDPKLPVNPEVPNSSGDGGVSDSPSD